jgi:hypothetical protein
MPAPGTSGGPGHHVNSPLSQPEEATSAPHGSSGNGAVSTPQLRVGSRHVVHQTVMACDAVQPYRKHHTRPKRRRLNTEKRIQGSHASSHISASAVMSGQPGGSAPGAAKSASDSAPGGPAREPSQARAEGTRCKSRDSGTVP